MEKTSSDMGCFLVVFWFLFSKNIWTDMAEHIHFQTSIHVLGWEPLGYLQSEGFSLEGEVGREFSIDSKWVDAGLWVLRLQNVEGILFKINTTRPSLVAQQSRIHLLMQETRVLSLIQEDPAYLGATKSMHHKY